MFLFDSVSYVNVYDYSILVISVPLSSIQMCMYMAGCRLSVLFYINFSPRANIITLFAKS